MASPSSHVCNHPLLIEPLRHDCSTAGTHLGDPGNSSEPSTPSAAFAITSAPRRSHPMREPELFLSLRFSLPSSLYFFSLYNILYTRCVLFALVCHLHLCVLVFAWVLRECMFVCELFSLSPYLRLSLSVCVYIHVCVCVSM